MTAVAPNLPGEYVRRRLTVEEYTMMAEIGIFAPDEHVDLVEGCLVSYAPPHGPAHAGAVWGFTETLHARLRGRAALWAQLPVIMSETTELEPDLAVLVPRAEGYRRSLPRIEDVYGVIEVADSSLFRDRNHKLRLYAASGIPEYWIVDVRRDRIETYRGPVGDEYGSYRLARRGDEVSFAALSDIVLSVDELLG
ncbi:MAG TPA: Uma2 family endonuclease [Candidatus Elarobacter sp.]|jgi:Uma2 family endonuclease